MKGEDHGEESGNFLLEKYILKVSKYLQNIYSYKKIYADLKVSLIYLGKCLVFFFTKQ